MRKKFLETGIIVNTHGTLGEVKIQPWSDGPEFLLGFKKFYIDEKSVRVLHAGVHKGCVIAALEGVDDINAAIALKNKVVFIDRDDAPLPPGQHYIQDLLGLDILDFDTGEKVGTLKDVLDLPAHRVYVIDCGKEVLVPAVPEFVKEKNPDEGYIKIRFIEGMRE